MPSSRRGISGFQSTPLMRGETNYRLFEPQTPEISIHSPHARGDPRQSRSKTCPSHFNPLPSCEGRPAKSVRTVSDKNISIHSPHARGDKTQSAASTWKAISIHSPHARGDRLARDLDPRKHISIHSPHARGDSTHARRAGAPCAFQSTPLMRGETVCRAECIRIALHFNPLPSCEGRRISRSMRTQTILFQSTPLMRGETAGRAIRERQVPISIHSPHARGDNGKQNPHIQVKISIHSPHARGDGVPDWWEDGVDDFHPLPSCEGRLPRPENPGRGTNFNPLPSCEGRRGRRGEMPHEAAFQSTPLMRGETSVRRAPVKTLQFQSTPLMRGETA